MEEMRNDIRDRLKRYALSFTWLVNQLEKRGISTDKTEISSVFAGTRKGAKAESIVETSKDILSKYESTYLREV